MSDWIWLVLVVVFVISGIACGNLSLRRDIILKPISDWFFFGACMSLLCGLVSVFFMVLD